MAYQYALPGPPFHFSGNFSETQFNAFQAWVNARASNAPAIQTHHQIRAQQLRKTAGLLEKYYATANGESLPLNFQKEPWLPGPDGQWCYTYRNDHLPAVTMNKVKGHFRFQLQRQEEATFHMQHLRNQIERQEDLAQHNSTTAATVPALLTTVQTLFSQPEYQAVLVKDISDKYKGEPRFRVNQLDYPTQWEKERANHGATADTPIALKGV